MADVPVNFSGKILGWNLTSKPGFPLESDYWIEWDWTGWIQKQIDYAVDILKANAVRIIGDVAMVINAEITQATYNAHLAQFVAYCAGRGVSIYLTGCATYDTNGDDNGTIAAYAAGHQAFADVMTSQITYITGGAGGDYTSWIIGYDLVQEANAWNNATAVADIYGKVQPSVPSSIGCTFSTSDPTNSSWLASIISYCDFIDLHVYPQVLGITDEIDEAWLNTNIRTPYPNKDVLFGEGGVNRNNYFQGQRENWILGLGILGLIDDSKVRGTLCWAIQNQDEPYGAFDGSWNPVEEIVQPWLQVWGLVPGVIYVQSAFAYDDSSATSIPVTLTGIGAGNCLVAFVKCANPSGAVTVTDGVNTWTQVDSTTGGATNASTCASFVAANVASGSTTITAHYTGGAGFGRIIVVEARLARTVNPVNAHEFHNLNAQGLDESDTNAISSAGSASTTVDGCLLIGFYVDHDGNVGYYPGTVYVLRVDEDTTPNEFDRLRAETSVQAIHGAAHATWTPSSSLSGAAHTTVMMVALAPSSSARRIVFVNQY